MHELLQQLINGLSLGAVYALIAVGYTMVYGTLRLINFAHGDVFMVGAMAGLYLFARQPEASGDLSAAGWGFLIIMLALAVLAIGVLALRPVVPAFRRMGKTPLVTLIVLLLVAAGAPLVRWHSAPHEPSWLALALVLVGAMVVCSAVGFAIEQLAYRPLRNSPRITSLITAIGVSMFLEFGGQHPAVFGPTPQPFPDMLPRPMSAGFASVNYHIFGVVIDRVDVLVFTLTILFMLILSWIVMRTRAGLALRAVSWRFDTASLMGVNTDRIISLTFIIGSALAAVGGVLWGIKYRQVDPLMGLIPGLKAFIAAVLGGIGNIPGAVLGGFVLGLTEILVVAYLPNGSQYRDAVAFVILIVILLVKPSGLLGSNAIEKV
jgi:branched-chain amino acid transport system permease protein